MNIAANVSMRGTCRAQTGSVVVDTDNRIVGTGYNGSIPGQPHCTAIGCEKEGVHCIRTIHAERNAILHGDVRRMRNGTIYVWRFPPCFNCAQEIATAGLKRVVYSIKGEHDHQEYDELPPTVAHLFKQAGIEAVHLTYTTLYAAVAKAASL